MGPEPGSGAALTSGCSFVVAGTGVNDDADDVAFDELEWEGGYMDLVELNAPAAR